MRRKVLVWTLTAGLLLTAPVSAVMGEDLQTAQEEVQQDTAQEDSLQADAPAEETALADAAGEELLQDAEDTSLMIEAQAPEQAEEETGMVEEAPAQDGGAAEEKSDKESDEKKDGNADGLIEDTGKDVAKHDGDGLEEILEKETVMGGFTVDPSRYPAANITENTQTIYKYLREEMGLNHAAACGVLANVHLESNFRPMALGDGGTSYGICQWHLGRFMNLMAFCRSRQLDYNTLDGQLPYLQYELTHGYNGVYEFLRGVSDTEQGAYYAAYYFCLHFEVPDQTVARSEQRGNLAMHEYYGRNYDEVLEKTEEEEKEQLRGELIGLRYITANTFREEEVNEETLLEAMERLGLDPALLEQETTRQIPLAVYAMGIAPETETETEGETGFPAEEAEPAE